MKCFLALIFIVFNLSSFAKTGVYLSSGNRYDVESIDDVMNEVFSSGPVKFINIFIHGRGKHPEKGLEIMSDIEKSYGVKTIMFHWPSWKSAVKRPLGNAITSAESLSIFLSGINRYVRSHPLRMFRIKRSLLVHSMGNIVFKEMMDNYYQNGDFKRNLFSTIIFNAADVPFKYHKQWIDRVDFSKENYITFNDNDIVLFGSEKLDRFNNDYEEYEGARLGKNLIKSVKNREDKLSSNAKYLNLSKLTFTGHRHFMIDDKKKNVEMKTLFSRIMKGQYPYLDRRDGMYKLKSHIYNFKRN